MTTNTKLKQNLIIYGHDYCSQSRALVATLNKNEIAYEWRDITTGPPEYKDDLKTLANGYLSVPTVIFADGTVMVEPWAGRVLKKLGYTRPGLLDKLFGRWVRAL